MITTSSGQTFFASATFIILKNTRTHTGPQRAVTRTDNSCKGDGGSNALAHARAPGHIVGCYQKILLADPHRLVPQLWGEGEKKVEERRT